jgi:hypothetical protein
VRYQVDRLACRRTLPRERFSPMARTGLRRMGRACPLCPCNSDINLFCYCQSVVDLNPEIPDGALDFRVAEQELNGSKITGAPID